WSRKNCCTASKSRPVVPSRVHKDSRPIARGLARDHWPWGLPSAKKGTRSGPSITGSVMVRKFLLVAVCAVAMAQGATAATRSMLYVANSQGDDISIIDLSTQKVVKTSKVGPIVHGVCAQADGRRAFATIESENSLKVIDTKTSTVTDTIPLGGRPNECAATNDGRYVVVPLLAPANLSVVVDVAEKKIVK